MVIEQSYMAKCPHCRRRTLHEEETYENGRLVACTKCLHEEFISNEDREREYWKSTMDECW